MTRIERLRPILTCPSCQGALAWSDAAAQCTACSQTYPIRNGRIYFIAPMGAEDNLDVLKYRLKKLLGRFYYSFGVAVLAPGFPFRLSPVLTRTFDLDRELVIDLGAGARRADPRLFTLDASDYDSVDIVADVARLPFKAASVDGFVSTGLIEHVPHPERIALEIARCTKPLGRNLHLLPFLYPYHASPHDFQRFSPSGAISLFPEDWTLVEQKNATGPVSLFLICLVDFLATLFSLPIPRLRGAIYLALSALLSPVKWLDAPFIGRKSFIGLAPTILTILRRPE